MKKSLTALTKTWPAWLATLGLLLLAAVPRFTALNGYLIVDEPDRWRWAENFVWALSRGDLAATLVGDGYPGIVPVWAETIWVFLEAGRRSLAEGQWIGEPGLYLLFHQWDRIEFLIQQRLPIVLLNTALALAVIWAVWRLFGGRVALVGGLLIALDPFYLSDSRVNRAEAVITGLMTLSMLFLIFYHRRRRFRYVLISGVLGGLSFLTKIQALAMLPAVALVGLGIHAGSLFPLAKSSKEDWLQLIRFGLGWLAAAVLTWFVLWPAMWVIPGETLSLVYNYATRKVGAEGVNLFFLGETFEDTDPGPFFYPLVLLLRITPLALVGLLAAGWRFTRRALRSGSVSSAPVSVSGNKGERNYLARFGGSFILVSYIVVYALVMSLGSHKQDRYLLPIFLSLDILAAIGLVYVGAWLFSGGRSRKISWGLLAGLVVIQLATVIPHHPYYYSYFNPLLGGGRTAVQTMRIGWGEGMDQVGAYLAAKPDSRELVVSSRFTHNMLGFKGELISLTPGGRWTGADYIVLYIQQVQRRQEPSPGFIDYFQARSPEKVITLGGIEYAWIYPIPFSMPADPQISRISGQAALLGASLEANGEGVTNGPGEKDPSPPPWRFRLLWDNLGMHDNRQLVARLVGSGADTAWRPCYPGPAFTTQARTPGAYVESLCAPSLAGLQPDTYTIEFGLTSSPLAGETAIKVDPFLFPAGWQAITMTAEKQLMETPEMERLDAIARRTVPASAQRLDRVYGDRLRLIAYALEPSQPQVDDDSLVVSLYWQLVRETPRPVQLTVQLADSRSISLGRADAKLDIDRWLPGQVTVTRHSLNPAFEGQGPLAARLEVSLTNGANVIVPVTGRGGRPQETTVARFTLAPRNWPDLAELAQDPLWRETKAAWQNGLALRGYFLSPEQARPGDPIQVRLFWAADRSVPESYVVFVHLVDGTGQIKAQSDALPRTGAYPTSWWQPGRIVEDTHLLTLPQALPGGNYRLVVGLYRPEDGVRLPMTDGSDSFAAGGVEIQAEPSP